MPVGARELIFPQRAYSARLYVNCPRRWRNHHDNFATNYVATYFAATTPIMLAAQHLSAAKPLPVAFQGV